MTDASTKPGEVAIRRVEQADAERVTDVLGRAFDDDPVMNFIAKQDERRSQRIRKMMSVALSHMTLPYGECYVASGYEGAALWNPPDGRPHGLLSDLKLIPEMIRIAGWRGLPRVFSALNELEKKHPKAPHYYLLAIGVEPDLQGRGIGTRLMAPILQRCDREGMPAYLESTKEQNLPLYERNGFAVTERIELAGGGPPMWPMWREPR